MTPHLILLCHATPDVAPMFGAAAAARGLDVDVVPIRSPFAGMSAAYDALAQACLRDGRVLPGLLAKYKPPRQGYASTWLVCWSGSYALARAMRPADRAELAGLVLLDGGHTTLDPDKTANDAGVQWLVDWAREAKAGRCTVWIGHTDVRTYGNVASTTDVAKEVLRFVGGQGGRLLVRAHNVAIKDTDEHVAARDGWGPAFVADAMSGALLGATPSEEPPPTQRAPRVLSVGLIGEDVKDWQDRLIALRYNPGVADKKFGPRTEGATKELQRDADLEPTGVVDAATRAAAERAQPRPNAASPEPPAPIVTLRIPARNFTKAQRPRADVVIIHSTESPRKRGGARAVANWFGGAQAPRASAHYVVDDDETICCVDEQSVAWAAPGANNNGVQIEVCGYAKQTADEWLSGSILARVASLVADICRRNAIPVEKLSSSDLVAGKRGITGHVDVSRAFKKSDHWDPGPGFPWARFLEMVRAQMNASPR